MFWVAFQAGHNLSSLSVGLLGFASTAKQTYLLQSENVQEELQRLQQVRLNSRCAP